MRALEEAAMRHGAVTGRELMETAGRGVVEAIFSEWPELAVAPQCALVLCGPGNNGGDGFVVARLLRGWGWDVRLHLYGDPGKLPPDARANRDLWAEMGEVTPLTADDPPSSEGADLVVDALFGIGLTRPVALPLSRWSSHLEGARRVAVDLPSGLCSDSGRRLGPEGGLFTADLTVTFHRIKLGHVLGEGPAACGRTRVVDIGLRRAADGGTAEPAARLVPAASRDRLGKAGGAHKFTHGHALVLSGGAGRTGAARLAARGALRIGAGLATLGVPGSAQLEVATQVTAIMLCRVDDAAALAEVLEDRRLTALCLGPGLGVERAAALLPAALQAKHCPAVLLDADALTAVAQDDGLLGALHDRCVLTPHAGEFARLFPDLADCLSEPPRQGPAFSRLDAARAAAERAGCVVLLKGPDTVIADASGAVVVSAAVYERAAPWLATAGAGDVLSGFVTGLLARGFAPMEAAATASRLHIDCALAFGPGLIAEDLPEMLPGVLRAL